MSYEITYLFPNSSVQHAGISNATKRAPDDTKLSPLVSVNNCLGLLPDDIIPLSDPIPTYRQLDYQGDISLSNSCTQKNALENVTNKMHVIGLRPRQVLNKERRTRLSPARDVLGKLKVQSLHLITRDWVKLECWIGNISTWLNTLTFDDIWMFSIILIIVIRPGAVERMVLVSLPMI